MEKQNGENAAQINPDFKYRLYFCHVKWKAIIGILLILGPYALKLGWQMDYWAKQVQYEKNCIRKIEIPVCRGQCQIQKQLVQIELGASKQKPTPPSKNVLSLQLVGAFISDLEQPEKAVLLPHFNQLPCIIASVQSGVFEPIGPPPKFV